MNRLMLSDERWSKLSTIMLNHGIYDKASLRQTVEGILHRLRVGCPWRDLPREQFGDWNRIYKRFNDWSRCDKLMTIFKVLAKDPDMEWKFIDGSIVKAHQHSCGARKGEERAIGKSVAGNTSKIHMVTDSSGNPIDFEITEGQNRHLVENLFARLKHFRGMATRFDKLKRNYEGTLAIACAYLWLKL